MLIWVPMVLRQRRYYFGEDATESVVPLEIFKSHINYATAVSSILALSAEQAVFKPSEKSAESVAQTLDYFVFQVSIFPGVYLTNNSQRTLTPKNHTTVAEFQKETTRLKNWVLNVVVLDKPEGSDKISMQLVRVDLSIAFDEDPKTCSGPIPTPKAYIPEQSASIVFATFELNTSFLISNAQ
ncbi:hypothetical protein CPB97_003322, partial [Podila verticillata]